MPDGMRHLGRFADRAQQQAAAAAVQEPLHRDERRESEIDEGIEAKQQGSQDRDVAQHGDCDGLQARDG